MIDCKLLVYERSIEINNSFRKEVRNALQEDDHYATILAELETGERKEMVKTNEKYEIKNGLLVLHLANHMNDIPYWRLVALVSREIKKNILTK